MILLRQVEYLNNGIEQIRHPIKKQICPMLELNPLETVKHIITGIEAIHTYNQKGQTQRSIQNQKNLSSVYLD
ncbi:transposase [Priestia filamentosa]